MKAISVSVYLLNNILKVANKSHPFEMDEYEWQEYENDNLKET
jgi:hypothetical protein